MPRAAVPYAAGENLPDNNIAANGQQPEVFTTLRSTIDSDALTRERPRDIWMDPSCVAGAFITNLSGGAACYDVDLGLVANGAMDEDATEALNSMRRLMQFADSASWMLADRSASLAVIVATATTGTGDDSTTDTQQFTLHIDIAAERPITSILPHPRKSSNANFVLGQRWEPCDALQCTSCRARPIFPAPRRRSS